MSANYQRVPNEESIEMKSTSAPQLPKVEEPAPPLYMVVFSVGFYLVAAIVMVMVNKWVLNSVKIPLFLLFCQLAIAVVCLQVCAVFGFMKLPRLDPIVCKGLIPLLTCNVLGLAFNTYCLQYVDASFYQVARGLVLPITVFFSWFLLRTRSSSATLSAVGLVCIGFLAGVLLDSPAKKEGSAAPSFIGVALGVASSVTTAVHAIVVKRSLAIVSGTLDLAYFSNLLSAFIILPFVVLSGEASVVMDMVLSTEGENAAAFGTFLWGAFITGIFGFLICIAGFLSIKVTSPISHMISAAVRGVLQTFLGMWFFGDKVGGGRALSIFFILSGSVFYVYSKSIEGNAPPRPTPNLGAQTPGQPSFKGFTPAVAQDQFRAASPKPDGDEKPRTY